MFPHSVALLATLLPPAHAADPIFSLACRSEYLCRGLAADSQGKIFISGTTWDGVPGSPVKAYVGRLDGSALAFFKEIGGSPFDQIHDMVVDV